MRRPSLEGGDLVYCDDWQNHGVLACRPFRAGNVEGPSHVPYLIVLIAHICGQQVDYATHSKSYRCLVKNLYRVRDAVQLSWLYYA